MTPQEKTEDWKWREEFEKEFNEFIVKPPPRYEVEEPYKIGDRNYTGEHFIYPAYHLNETKNPSELERFIEKILEIQKQRLNSHWLKKIEEIEKIIKARLKYCQEQNGLPYCKNCGLKKDDLSILKKDY